MGARRFRANQHNADVQAPAGSCPGGVGGESAEDTATS